MKIHKGKLEVICGSMFSGKSEELIRRLIRAEIAKQKTCVFKPKIDTRTSVDYIHGHNSGKMKAIALEDPIDMLLFIKDDIQVIGIDEAQFFNKSIIDVVTDLVEAGKRVIVGGLDLDFRGIPFGYMPILMAIADSVTKLQAVCVICGKDARFTQRLIDNKPAKFNDPLVIIGAQEYYQARCRDCFIIDSMPAKELQL